MVIEVKPLQLEKHQAPNEVTDEGMVIEVKPLQPWKQAHPNEVTDEGIVIEVKPLQPEYVDIIGYQLFVVNTVEKWMCFLLAYGRKPRFNVFNLILQEKCEFNEGNDTIRRMIVRKTVRSKKKP